MAWRTPVSFIATCALFGQPLRVRCALKSAFHILDSAELVESRALAIEASVKDIKELALRVQQAGLVSADLTDASNRLNEISQYLAELRLDMEQKLQHAESAGMVGQPRNFYCTHGCDREDFHGMLEDVTSIMKAPWFCLSVVFCVLLL